MPNVILLKGDQARRYDELRIAAGVTTFKPGMMADKNAAGEAILFATAGGVGEKIIVLERYLMGDMPATTTYAAGDLIGNHIPKAGDEYQLLLLGGENVTPVDYLTPDGTGKFKKAAGADVKMFKVLKALNLTALPDALVEARAL